MQSKNEELHKIIADIFCRFTNSAYICIINKTKGDLTYKQSSPKFEIVFSSLYKFCEGMFRRETGHSHFLSPISPLPDFRNSLRVVL